MTLDGNHLRYTMSRLPFHPLLFLRNKAMSHVQRFWRRFVTGAPGLWQHAAACTTHYQLRAIFDTKSFHRVIV
jgi:hypothetical protein